MGWSQVTLCSRDTTPTATQPVVLVLERHTARKFPLGLGVCRVLVPVPTGSDSFSEDPKKEVSLCVAGESKALEGLIPSGPHNE